MRTIAKIIELLGNQALYIFGIATTFVVTVLAQLVFGVLDSVAFLLIFIICMILTSIFLHRFER